MGNLFFLCFFALFNGCVPFAEVGNKYTDLSHPITETIQNAPGHSAFTRTPEHEESSNFVSHSFCMSEHTGTHLDAPSHLNKDSGWTLDQIPTDYLIDIPAVVIDVSNKVKMADNPSAFTLLATHLAMFEIMERKVPNGGVLLVHTGWGKYWGDQAKYWGWENSTEEGSSHLNFPGVSEGAAEWLLKERRIVGVGIDTGSVDPGYTKTHPAHKHLAGHQVYNIENMANLGELVYQQNKEGCSIHLLILPMKIHGGSGAPVRVLAYCKPGKRVW